MDVNAEAARIIRERGWLTEPDLKEALERTTRAGTGLPDSLVMWGLLTNAQAEELKELLPDQGQQGDGAGDLPPTLGSPDGKPPVRFSLPPSIAGRYRVLRLLGRGGMGQVYLAVQEGLDREVAIKMLAETMRGSTEMHDRFQREARALARLSHPGITPVFDYGVEDGHRYFVMEYIEGWNLASVMPRYKGDLPASVQVATRTLEALAYAHGHGVVHRDIKPANILLGKDSVLKVADFGLAKMAEAQAPQLTQTSYAMGTPHYMAPEQGSNPKAVDHRADLYSVGVLLYELLTGKKPIGRFSPPSEAVDVDPAIDPIILRLLEPDPNNRYQNAEEVLQVLAPFRTQAEAPTAMVNHDERHKGPADRKRLGLIVAASLAAIALAAALVFFATREGKDSNGKTTPSPMDWYENLQLTRDDIPANWPWPPPRSSRHALPRNPYVAKTTEERDTLLTVLNDQGLRAVSAAEIARGYHVHLAATELPVFTLLDFVDDDAARRARDIISSDGSRECWGHLEGKILAFAACSKQMSVGVQRYLFEHIVAATQQKLGQTPDDLMELRPLYLDPVLELDALPDASLLIEAYAGNASYLLNKTWAAQLEEADVPRLATATYSLGGKERGWFSIQRIVARVDDAENRKKLHDAWVGCGGRPLERAPFLSTVLVSRMDARGDPWDLPSAVDQARRQLEQELSQTLDVDPPALSPELRLALDARELPSGSRFADMPLPSAETASASQQAVQNWLIARGVSAADIESLRVSRAWSATIDPGRIHVLFLEAPSAQAAATIADALLPALSQNPKRDVVLQANSYLACVLRADASISQDNAFFGLVGRLALRLAPHR